MVAAGIQEIDTLQTATRDIIMRQFEVNALGPVLVVQALLPRLQPGSKVRSRNRLGVRVWQTRTLVWCSKGDGSQTPCSNTMQVVLIASKMGSIAAVGLTGAEMVGVAAASPMSAFLIWQVLMPGCARGQ